MTLPNNSVFNFYEGTDPQHYTDLTGVNLNAAANALMANDVAIKTAVSSLESRMTAEETEDFYVNNGITVITTKDGWHQYTVSFYDSANWPNCTNDMQFFEIVKFHRNGSTMVEIEIQSQHRGMNNGYHEKTTLQTSGSQDGLYFQGTKVGRSGHHGFLLNGGDITNDRANYTRFVPPQQGHVSYVSNNVTTPAEAPLPFEFTLKGIGDSSWNNSKLVMAVPPSCGSNKHHTIVVRWRGSSNDITPMAVHTNTNTNSSAVNIAVAPEIHNT